MQVEAGVIEQKGVVCEGNEGCNCFPIKRKEV